MKTLLPTVNILISYSAIYISLERHSYVKTVIVQTPNITDISAMYTDIVSALLVASKPHLKRVKRGKVLPGWNTYVAEFYAEAREATNTKYKYAIRFISKNEQSLRADSMAKKLNTK